MLYDPVRGARGQVMPTEAGEFPCSYAIDVVLVFGPDDALKQKYIHRFPLCP
jgi:hypothetical protein